MKNESVTHDFKNAFDCKNIGEGLTDNVKKLISKMDRVRITIVIAGKGN